MNTTKQYINWELYLQLINRLSDEISNGNVKYNSIYGIPRGGLIPATIISHKLDIPLIGTRNLISDGTLIVDDIADTGATLSKYENYHNAVIIWKSITSCIKPTYWAMHSNDPDWIVFPYEIDIERPN